MLNLSKVSFKCKGETLAGVISKSNNVIKPSLIFLHGAGQSDKSRTYYLMEQLQRSGIPSFAFDFSGHGNSSGKLKESSLKKRTEEAACAIKKFLTQTKPITVCGSSMSGHISIKLLEQFKNIENVILFCPAVYDKKAYSAQFKAKFTSIIRKENSWKNSDIFTILEKYKGNLLIFIGENDNVIPEGVIDLLDKHSSKVQKKEIVIVPKCKHMIHAWISQRSLLLNEVVEKITELLK